MHYYITLFIYLIRQDDISRVTDVESQWSPCVRLSLLLHCFTSGTHLHRHDQLVGVRLERIVVNFNGELDDPHVDGPGLVPLGDGAVLLGNVDHDSEGESEVRGQHHPACYCLYLGPWNVQY